MKTLIQLEELAFFAAGIFSLYLQPLEFSWWTWILLFLSPDIGMAGYLISTKFGAATYNVFHHRFIAVGLAAGGYFTSNSCLLLYGLIMFAHSSFDRALGYGLKHDDHFRHTHLGWIGVKNKEK